MYCVTVGHPIDSKPDSPATCKQTVVRQNSPCRAHLKTCLSWARVSFAVRLLAERRLVSDARDDSPVCEKTVVGGPDPPGAEAQGEGVRQTDITGLAVA